jgi:hypothetical protein
VIELSASDVRTSLYAQFGKYSLGKGYNSIGDLVSFFFSQAGFANIRTYYSDKALPLIPPYDTPDQSYTIKLILDWERNNTGHNNDQEKSGFCRIN